MMKKYLIISVMAIIPFLFAPMVQAQAPLYTQCNSYNGRATCTIDYEDSSVPYIITSITISATGGITMHHIYGEDTWPYRLIWAGTATDSVTIDVDDFVLPQDLGAVYRIFYLKNNFERFSITYTLATTAVVQSELKRMVYVPVVMK